MFRVLVVAVLLPGILSCRNPVKEKLQQEAEERLRKDREERTAGEAAMATMRQRLARVQALVPMAPPRPPAPACDRAVASVGTEITSSVSLGTFLYLVRRAEPVARPADRFGAPSLREIDRWALLSDEPFAKLAGYDLLEGWMRPRTRPPADSLEATLATMRKELAPGARASAARRYLVIFAPEVVQAPEVLDDQRFRAGTARAWFGVFDTDAPGLVCGGTVSARSSPTIESVRSIARDTGVVVSDSIAVALAADLAWRLREAAQQHLAHGPSGLRLDGPAP
jgi:hypothetical protein